MKRAVRPVRDFGHISVLDRIEMDVVDMPLQIPIIADGMLPIAALPDSAFAARRLARRARHLSGKTARKSTFDQAPAQGEIGVAIWKRPYACR
jgi:hypothetical protein